MIAHTERTSRRQETEDTKACHRSRDAIRLHVKDVHRVEKYVSQVVMGLSLRKQLHAKTSIE